MYYIFNPKNLIRHTLNHLKFSNKKKKKKQEKTPNHSNISLLNKTHISKYITMCIGRERERERLTDSQ
jgi:hypothetical protein